MAWTGKDENARAFAALRTRLIAAAEATVTSGSFLLQNQARENASHRPGPEVRTGNLRRGIITTPVKQTGVGQYESSVRSTVVYGRIQERGGTIFPHRHQFLYWQGVRRDGSFGWISKRSVTLPARPYLGPAIPMVAPKYQALAERNFAAAILGG